MAANSGVKIFRDFLRDSPCRMAYMMTQQKNFTQQYSKNHSLGKAVPLERPGTARPKTAPIAPSNLAQAITHHNLMPEPVAAPKRPSTSARLVKPNLDFISNNGLLAAASRRPGSPKGKTIRRPEVPRRPSEQIRKRPPGSSVEDLRKPRQQQHKQSKSQHHGREAPNRPCKICTNGEDCPIPEQWQDLLNTTPASSVASSGGFRHLIAEIERIRSELVSREDIKQIGLQQSLELINEIKQRIDSVSAASGGRSYLSQLEPSQTATVLSKKKIKARKSVRSLRFEGGRIVEKDYTKVNRGGDVPKVKKSQIKQVEKKFDEGPLRMLLPFMRGSLTTKEVKF